MEERKIYRGNFVNFMTGKVDDTLAYSNQYSLKIVEGGKEYFYKVKDSVFISECKACEPETFNTVVSTEWKFLNYVVQDAHICAIDSKSARESSEKDLSFLDAWAEQFSNVPKEFVLRLYQELGYCFKEMQHKKKYVRDIKSDDELFFRDAHQINEFEIDKEWYVYLGRRLVRGQKTENDFKYIIKRKYVVDNQTRKFRKQVEMLKKKFQVPHFVASSLLNACNGDVESCEEALQDVSNVRNKFLYGELTLEDKLYEEYLMNKKNFDSGFKHYIKGWTDISRVYRYFSHNVQKALAAYMIGR